MRNFLIFAPLLLLVSCRNNTQQAGGNGGRKVSLTTVLATGQERTVEKRFVHTTDADTPNGKMKAKMEMLWVWHVTALEPKAEGERAYRAVLRRTVIATEQNGQKDITDSDKEGGKPIGRFIVTLDDSGKLVGAVRVSEMGKEEEKLNGHDSKWHELRRVVACPMPLLPPNPVAVGDYWELDTRRRALLNPMGEEEDKLVIFRVASAMGKVVSAEKSKEGLVIKAEVNGKGEMPTPWGQMVQMPATGEVTYAGGANQKASSKIVMKGKSSYPGNVYRFTVEVETTIRPAENRTAKAQEQSTQPNK